MRRKWLTLLIGTAATAAMALGLSAGVGSAGPSKAQQDVKIFLLPKNLGNPYFNASHEGAKQAARELGVSVTYNAPTEATGTKQVPFIDTAVRQGYQAIIISAADANAVAPALRRAQQRNVKVITYDADTVPGARTVFVSLPDFKSVGEAQIEWLGSQIGYRGEFAILSATAVAPNQNQWIKFMRAALKKSKYRNMKLVKVAGPLAGLPQPAWDHFADDRGNRGRRSGAHPGRKVQRPPDGSGAAEPDAAIREVGLRSQVRALERGRPRLRSGAHSKGRHRRRYLRPSRPVVPRWEGRSAHRGAKRRHHRRTAVRVHEGKHRQVQVLVPWQGRGGAVKRPPLHPFE
jgi:Periplasmic binding protein domain